MLKLNTKRLILRDFSNKDLSEYIQLRDDEKFKRFYPDDEITQSKSSALIEMFISDSKELPRIKYQLAITTTNDTLIGSCGIRISQNIIASFGCELGRKYQVSGYAFEAAEKIINYAFSALNVQRIYAETISENKAAIKLCKQLGMTLDTEIINNTYFKHRWWNLSILEINRADYINRIKFTS